MEKNSKKNFIITSIFYLFIIFWSFLLIKYFVPATLPFWIGLFIANILKPAVIWLSSVFNFKRKSAAFSIILLFYIIIFLFLCGILTIFFNKIDLFIKDIPFFYSVNIQPFFHKITLNINGFLDDFSPQSAQFLMKKYSDFAETISVTLTDFSSEILLKTANLAKKIPFLLCTVSFSILCSVFISLDYNLTINFILKQFSPKIQKIIIYSKNFLKNSVIGMFRAYFILFIITFVQLLVGFLLLRINQAIIWAVIIAILDFLPFIGTGLVLIPWGIYEIFSARKALGFGILILYAIISLSRNIIEPKIVGKSIGLHPLATLVAMYAGLKFCGFLGLLLAPLAVLLLSELNNQGYFHFYK